MKRAIATGLTIALLTGCAGVQRGCSNWSASTFGSDWIVVQYRADGSPVNCWTLRNTSVENEDKSDGVHWLDSQSKHLVHIAGWYSRVQVSGGDFASAARAIGVDPGRCGHGAYGAAQTVSAPLR